MRLDGGGRDATLTRQAAADVALLGRMARGDRAALAAVYDRHAGAAYALAQRMCGSNRAEDVVEEAFLLLSGEVAAGQRSGPVRSRLLFHARRSALDRVYGPQHPAHAADPPDPGPAAAIDPVVLGRYERRAAAALEAVAARERRCIELAYFDGLSVSEIADRCQLAPLAVADHLRAGLRHMRRIMSTGLPSPDAG